MARPENPPDHEHERLNPGASTERPQPAGKHTPEGNSAALPGSPNSDLKGAKRDRSPRCMST